MGDKPSDESLRMSKRNNSLRGDTTISKPLVGNLSGHSIGLHDKQQQLAAQAAAVGGSVEAQDNFKNYRANRNSQEFYYKTLSLANNTMDRRELNSSINQKGPRLVQQDHSLSREKPTNVSSTAVNGRLEQSRLTSGLGSASVGAVPALADHSRNSPLVVHKRSNTFNDLMNNKLEMKKTDNHHHPTSQLSANTGKNLASTQPIQAKKASGGGHDHGHHQHHHVEAATSEFKVKPPSATQPMKEKRSSSFYNERKGAEDNLGGTSSSIDPKKAKRGDSGKRRTPGKVFNYIENIRRLEPQLPPFENARTVVKDFDRIKAFSVNTHQGTVRAYNEDRVSILLNAQQRYAPSDVASKTSSTCRCAAAACSRSTTATAGRIAATS